MRQLDVVQAAVVWTRRLATGPTTEYDALMWPHSCIRASPLVFREPHAKKGRRAHRSRQVSGRLVVRVALLLGLAAFNAQAQARAEYVGGTSAQLQPGRAGALDVSDQRFLAFYAKKIQVRVPYDRVELIEYGQQVSRRLAMAVIISTVLLLSKKRKHFLTVGYKDDDGARQALVFRVDKDQIRVTLVSLEARTGLRVQYQDEEARKAGKG